MGRKRVEFSNEDEEVLSEQSESSPGSSGEKPRPSKRRMSTAKLQAKLNQEADDAAAALLAGPEKSLAVQLTELYGREEAQRLCSSDTWVGKLSTAQLLQVLNAEHRQTQWSLEMECGENADSKVLATKHLSRLASASELWHTLFHSKTFGFWEKTTVARMDLTQKGEPCPPKYRFLGTYVAKNQMKALPPRPLGATLAYLNRYGAGACHACGMFPNMGCATHLPSDMIFISPYRALTQREREALAAEQAGPRSAKSQFAYDDSGFRQRYPTSTPDWLKNFYYMRERVPTRYRCANPACAVIVNEELAGIPLASVFHACETRRGKRKHSWYDLPNDLLAPSGEKIDEEWQYCYSCGLVRIAEDEEGGMELQCAHCDGDEEGRCVCETCPRCARMPNKCECVVCFFCKGCQSDKCGRVCEKRGKLCSCASSSSSSSSSNSSSYDSDEESSDSDSNSYSEDSSDESD